MSQSNRSFNSRGYRGQVERELILGAIVITLIIGGGLIALMWGGEAFLAALIFFLGALGLAGGVWGFLKVIEWLGGD